MKIKILKPVLLDIEGVQKLFEPSNKVITIDDELAKERNYVERYEKYSDYIEIVEGVKEEPKEEVEETKEEVAKEEVKPKSTGKRGNKKADKE